MIIVQMFGSFSIASGGLRLNTNLGRTGRLLAAYLLEFPGRVHPRDHLADMFWGDLERPRGRAALSTSLWRLRRILAHDPAKRADRHLITMNTDVVFEPCEIVQVDTHDLQAAVAALAQHHRAACDGMCRAKCAAAVEKYHGPFLEAEDHDWIREERERLHCLLIRGVNELINLAVQEGRYEDALAFARRGLAADPFRERLQRSLMLLLLLNGQRYQALEQYEKLKLLLKGELAVDPLPETQRLADEIRSGEVFSNIECRKREEFLLHSAPD